MSALDGGRPPRTVMHASGFVHNGRVSSVKLTSYIGDLEQVVPPIIDKIKSQGHRVEASRTKPLGDWWLVGVSATVFVEGLDGVTEMWHEFSYPSEQWESYATVTEADDSGSTDLQPRGVSND